MCCSFSNIDLVLCPEMAERADCQRGLYLPPVAERRMGLTVPGVPGVQGAWGGAAEEAHKSAH